MKKLEWKVYAIGGGDRGSVSFRLVATEDSKRKAVAHIPHDARNIVKNGRVYLYPEKRK